MAIPKRSKLQISECSDTLNPFYLLVGVIFPIPSPLTLARLLAWPPLQGSSRSSPCEGCVFFSDSLRGQSQVRLKWLEAPGVSQTWATDVAMWLSFLVGSM